MSVSAVSHQLRSLLAESTEAPSLAEVLATVDSFVLECPVSTEQVALLNSLDDELQAIHHDLVDHDSLCQTEIFLAVLHHLRPILSSASIIAIWFDFVLRPALREPKLPTAAINHAKELIICALEGTQNLDKVGEFRRRLLDLYLLDASGDNVLEWAELNQEQRDVRMHWKSNLEDLLIKFGLERPADLLTDMNNSFSTPPSRAQLFTLLNLYTSQKAFYPSASVLSVHPLMSSILKSLLLDDSSVICTVGLTVLVKLLPVLAVHARKYFRHLLPHLLAVLVRMICWKDRPVSNHPCSFATALQLYDSTPEEDIDIHHELEDDKPLRIRPDLGWERLESDIDATTSSAPSPRSLFTNMYYLFPRTTLRFLKEPAHCLAEWEIASPYTVSWEEALDEVKIRSKCESLARSHILHPSIIWQDASSEFSQPEFWISYDVSRIASECMMLDLRNASFGLREPNTESTDVSHTDKVSQPTRGFAADTAIITKPPDLFASQEDASTCALTPQPRPVDLELTPGRPRISLQDMPSTSVILKSNLDDEALRPTQSRPLGIFPINPSPPAETSFSLPLETEPTSLLQPQNNRHDQCHPMPSHVAQVISGLQREVLLLKNELNFELWLSRENVRHIGRLYQDQILSKNAEAERQGLHNKLRKYKAEVLGLERELKEHKEQASSAKNKYADWNTELQSKLREFREEKKSWITEAAALRSAEKEAQARFTAQGKLLADATKAMFELQTQKKETQHKVDRLRDYERQIEQHVMMQRLWDDDFQRFNGRGEELRLMKSEYRKMEIQLESYKKTLEQMDEQARTYRRQIQALEARLALAKKRKENSRHMPADEIAVFVKEKSSLAKANDKLREDNLDLRDEVEEMRAMLEMLKAQVGGRKGLVSARASPIMFPGSI